MKISFNCSYYSSCYVVIVVFLVGSMIRDLNINMGGSSNGANFIHINGQTPRDPARERISQFVEEGQMFFVREDQIALGRNLSNPIFPSMTNQVNNIEWFCKPVFSPDNDNDGNYDNVVSSFITFKFKGNKFGNTGGFSAAWSVGTTSLGGSYEEYGTNYKTRTNRYNDVGDSSRSSTIQWTLDGLGSTTGLVTSGEGRWTFDTTESIFDVFKEALGGRELTGETCKTIYDEIYVKKAKLITTPAPTRDPTKAPTSKSPKKKKSNKRKKSERKLQTLLEDDKYDVNEDEYASLKEQVDKLEKNCVCALGTFRWIIIKDARKMGFILICKTKLCFIRFNHEGVLGKD